MVFITDRNVEKIRF